ncbi:helix-turn-helix domain-containing protein [Burkholderia vietnamiensis]|uniref:helix-turn-helix domain-containing protein n=1 Tax=Burkholderia vietnamiensis TaxID=60552 RepID=UPI001B9AD993|nr:helix-turn-helix transcriptional regulator [Burkholderia vietnamiensis]MBR8206787.1 helix-turn-helix transcriptional regulator [Burkholderia vietnamiensis]MCA8395593.1 helix-turn-helix domain-containing protein [Burkholderia vietnamiensis]HDR8962074.1 helix-turn-helix transcriptional regulator [Burkholderia vietnamiensis]HDR9247816.1 helix-turn-helix transcriptional regulator [Burkholderia vietnamiensis]
MSDIFSPLGSERPTAEMLRKLRERSNRTQSQMATLLNLTERQYQRFEAGDSDMPLATWELLLRVWGARHPIDFMQVVDGPTRGWNTLRDAERDTIQPGDVVTLQPMVGPLVRATVTPSLGRERHHDPDIFGAQIAEFVDADDVGDRYQGFRIGEHVTFAFANVIHVEQRVPHNRDNVGLQLRLAAALRIGLRDTGELHFPGLAKSTDPIVGYILRPEKWPVIKQQLDAAQIPHVWRRLAHGCQEVREHGADWPTP